MMDRTLLIVGWTFIGWYGLQVLPFTSLVYRPEAVEVSNGEVTLARSFPGDALGLPRPRMSYVETVRPLSQTHNGGQSCSDAGGPFRYSRAEPIGVWKIDWARNCLSDPVGFEWSAFWYWHVGAIRLGPASLSQRTIHRH
jgi:hypothetical protein